MSRVMRRRCPRCGSENRKEKDRTSVQGSYKFFDKMRPYFIDTVTYVCDECGLIYAQEERR